MYLFFLLLCFRIAHSAHILSVTSSLQCVECTEWTAFMHEIEGDYPEMDVYHLDFFDDLKVLEGYGALRSRSMSVPTAFYVDNDRTLHEFQYEKSKSHMVRWLRDAEDGIYDLFMEISPNDGFEDRYASFVEIISTTAPDITRLVHAMPSIGFGWFPLRPPPEVVWDVANTTIVKGLHGIVSGQRGLDVKTNLLSFLLPSVIPYSLLDSLDTNIVKEILSALATEEVHLISDESLPTWWDEVSAEYPDYGFMHRNSTESGYPSPSTWTFRRGMDFVTATVSNRTWLPEVYAGNVAPVVRPSLLPEDRRTGVSEVSGDTLLDWLVEHPESFVYFYRDDDQSCQNVFAETSEPVARMIVPENDHEIFAVRPQSGTSVQFVAGRPVRVSLCSDLNFAKHVDL